ncbi:MAG TPA: YebC/PmpR family DNA-binding transcriptional regulator [Chlamydiales bacterium]|nr:YebC/PmpR family DNA-binding transcriptional regulator [Chlamydiales bacterium]
MAGHSKWANIKHKKDRADKKKGKIFSRLAKEIITAVKESGSDPKTNAKLRLIIQKAKSTNMPNDIIERNIKKASSADTANYSEMMYELYGYGGVGILVEALTDNKNRTASEIKIATNKRGGSIASPGSVSFNFDRKGVLQIEPAEFSEDDLFLIATEAGAEDFEKEEDLFLVTTSSEDLFKVKEALEEQNVTVKEASLEMIPKTIIECSQEDVEKNLALIDWLENIDDVDVVFHNMDE